MEFTADPGFPQVTEETGAAGEDKTMDCQLISTIDDGRRRRGVHAYPVIWLRAMSRYARWYATRALQILGPRNIPDPAAPSPSLESAEERRLQAGDWVRVKSRAEIEKLQQDADIADVVVFIPAPMTRYCGRTFRVLRVLDHYYDELQQDISRAENAVLLEGVTCDSSQLGSRRCDRGCLHFWKESWLVRVSPPETPAEEGSMESPPSAGGSEAQKRTAKGSDALQRRRTEFRAGELVRVRDRGSIEATLNRHGACEGVPFIAEHMAAYCGRHFIVSKPISNFFDEKADYMIRLAGAYILGGAYCDGRQAGSEPDCDRGCALIWHGEWLERTRAES